MSNDLQLGYANAIVGRIRNPFYSDETWYGAFELAPDAPEKRLIDYIKFSEDWNERVHRGEDADPGEFDRFSDLINSGLWFTRDEKGVASRITEAPVFFAGGELTWRTE